jgi:hypothetical protein
LLLLVRHGFVEASVQAASLELGLEVDARVLPIARADACRMMATAWPARPRQGSATAWGGPGRTVLPLYRRLDLQLGQTPSLPAHAS